ILRSNSDQLVIGQNTPVEEYEDPVFACLHGDDIAGKAGNRLAHSRLVLGEQPPVFAPTGARILVTPGLNPFEKVLVDRRKPGTYLVSRKAKHVDHHHTAACLGNIAPISIQADMLIHSRNGPQSQSHGFIRIYDEAFAMRDHASIADSAVGSKRARARHVGSHLEVSEHRTALLPQSHRNLVPALPFLHDLAQDTGAL